MFEIYQAIDKAAVNNNPQTINAVVVLFCLRRVAGYVLQGAPCLFRCQHSR